MAPNRLYRTLCCLLAVSISHLKFNEANEAGSAWPIQRLQVNVSASSAPKLINTIDKINHPEGTNATFTCTVASGDLNGLSYEWLKDEKTRISQLANPNKYRLSVGSENFQSALRVINLVPSDSGSYSCIARNRFGQDKISTWLNVKVQLKWLEQPRDQVDVPAGSPLQVACSAEGSPKALVSWTRIEKATDLAPNSELGAPLEQQQQLAWPDLRFHSISARDGGLYECRASNGVERDLVARTRINVLGQQLVGRFKIAVAAAAAAAATAASSHLKPLLASTLDLASLLMEIDKSLVVYLAQTFYNITPLESAISQLEGYSDRNYRIVDALDTNQASYVLKVVDERDSDEQLNSIIDSTLDEAYRHFSELDGAELDLRPARLIRTSGDKLSVQTSILVRCQQQQASAPDYELRKANVKLFDFFPGLTLYDFMMTQHQTCDLERQQKHEQLAGRIYLKLGKLCHKLACFFKLPSQRYYFEQMRLLRASSGFVWQLASCHTKLRRLVDGFFPEGADWHEQIAAFRDDGDANDDTDRQAKTRRCIMLKVLDEFDAIRAQLLDPSGGSPLNQVHLIHGDLCAKNILLSLSDDTDAGRNDNHDDHDHQHHHQPQPQHQHQHHQHQDHHLKFCLVDFMDLQVGCELIELAILIIYAVLEQNHTPFREALRSIPRLILAGFKQSGANGGAALNGGQLNALLTLMKLRLCQSLLLAMEAHSRDPENAYIMLTSERGWQLLTLLDQCEPASLIESWTATLAEQTLATTTTMITKPADNIGLDKGK